MPALAAHCDRTAQQQGISTDRATVSNSSTVVPCRSLQVESGITISHQLRGLSYDLPESDFRYGLANKTELRLNAPVYFQNYGTGGRFVTGVGDLLPGVKQQFAATKSGFNLAGIAAVSLPTGADDVTSHGYDPLLQLMPSQQVRSDVTLGGMLSVAWPTQNGSRNITGQASAEVDWNFRKPANLYAEYSGSFAEVGGTQHTVDFVGLYRSTRRQQLDVRGGFVFTSVANDRFLGVGYSYRFDF